MSASVSQWLGAWPVPCTLEMAAAQIDKARQVAAAGSAVPFAIERQTDGAVLGWISVTRDPAQHRRAILSYWLGEAHHGHGYMREAAGATVRFAFEHLGLDVIGATAHPENAASIAVIRGCGMAYVGESVVFASSRNREEACVLYEIARP